MCACERHVRGMHRHARQMLCACMFEQVRGMRVHVRGMSVVRPKYVHPYFIRSTSVESP